MAVAQLNLQALAGLRDDHYASEDWHGPHHQQWADLLSPHGSPRRSPRKVAALNGNLISNPDVDFSLSPTGSTKSLSAESFSQPSPEQSSVEEPAFSDCGELSDAIPSLPCGADVNDKNSFQEDPEPASAVLLKEYIFMEPVSGSVDQSTVRPPSPELTPEPDDQCISLKSDPRVFSPRCPSKGGSHGQLQSKAGHLDAAESTSTGVSEVTSYGRHDFHAGISHWASVGFGHLLQVQQRWLPLSMMFCVGIGLLAATCKGHKPWSQLQIVDRLSVVVTVFD